MDKWRDVGTVFLGEGSEYAVLWSCPTCHALATGEDVDAHEEWHREENRKRIAGPDPRLYGGQ